MSSKTSKQDQSKKEAESEAHRLYRAVPGHEPRHGPSDQGRAKSDDRHPVNGIVSPASTGVMYVSERASANGWTPLKDDWANFGQGAPEVGDLPGGSPRPGILDLNKMGADVNEYAPTTGVRELREAVANLYNVTYREGKISKYTLDNVAIVPGGRAGLTRVASIIGQVYVSYQVPEYTAYDQMLSSFRKLVPIPSILEEEDAYHLNIDKLERNIREQGLSVVVASNPRNPTGQVIHGAELEKMVNLGRKGTTIILDEFYSWYQYELGEGACVSAAEYIEDVEKDSVVLIDGLTKNFRLPGWRVAWVIGPKSLISALGSAGGYLDGGANHVLQMAAIELLDPARVKQDRLALQHCFREKRDHVMKRLEDMGLPVKVKPTSTFYIWLDLSDLPAPLNGGLVFFEELLKERVIVTPGIFFDLNPAMRRSLYDSPCHHFIRLSFGPPMKELDRGLDGFERVLKKARGALDEGKDLYDFIDKDLATKPTDD